MIYKVVRVKKVLTGDHPVEIADRVMGAREIGRQGAQKENKRSGKNK